MGLIRGGVLLSVALLFAAAAVPEAAAKRYIVGGKEGWGQSGVNYTMWAEGINFNIEDWLFFVYDRNIASVLEVTKADYETCNFEHPLHNWTTGAGRDVVPLNVTKTFYFISKERTCNGGMKVAIHVLKPRHPPTPSPPLPPPPPSSLPSPSPSPSPPPPPPPLPSSLPSSLPSPVPLPPPSPPPPPTPSPAPAKNNSSMKASCDNIEMCIYYLVTIFTWACFYC